MNACLFCLCLCPVLCSVRKIYSIHHPAYYPFETQTQTDAAALSLRSLKPKGSIAAQAQARLTAATLQYGSADQLLAAAAKAVAIISSAPPQT